VGRQVALGRLIHGWLADSQDTVVKSERSSHTVAIGERRG